MVSSIDKALRDLMNASLAELEKVLGCDVFNYFGPIADGQENTILGIIEDLAKTPEKKRLLGCNIDNDRRKCSCSREVCKYYSTPLR